MITFDANVVVHIDESLSDGEMHDLEKRLAGMEGVVSTCAHERAPHLLLVDYDPQDLETGALLRYLRRDGLHPRLVGGI